uniref:Ig-like domain-containing protein n=1 Tax=Lepisosteus oculatus TaxID=7918 RepID=W5MPR6_LEPOC
MISLLLLGIFYLTAGIFPQDVVVQPHLSVTTQSGDLVTLECTIVTTRLINWIWFKQFVGQPPRYIATAYGNTDRVTFYDEFENNPRFTVRKESSRFILSISQVRPSDMATYYCGAVTYSDVLFGNGTALLLTEGESRSSVCEAVCVSEHTGQQLCMQCVTHREMVSQNPIISGGAPCHTAGTGRCLGSTNTTQTDMTGCVQCDEQIKLFFWLSWARTGGLCITTVMLLLVLLRCREKELMY